MFLKGKEGLKGYTFSIKTSVCNLLTIMYIYFTEISFTKLMLHYLIITIHKCWC
jgi:hypothetical protein